MLAACNIKESRALFRSRQNAGICTNSVPVPCDNTIYGVPQRAGNYPRHGSQHPPSTPEVAGNPKTGIRSDHYASGRTIWGRQVENQRVNSRDRRKAAPNVAPIVAVQSCKAHGLRPSFGTEDELDAPGAEPAGAIVKENGWQSIKCRCWV
jgi:hypothetical protein